MRLVLARSNLLKISTQLDSLVRQIDLQIAQLKVTGCFKQSAEVTHMLNQMLRLEEVQAIAQQMNMEMAQAGLVGEMVDETLDQALEQEEPEDQELAVRNFRRCRTSFSRAGGRGLRPICPPRAHIQHRGQDV
jgi:hypothetical protein